MATIINTISIKPKIKKQTRLSDFASIALDAISQSIGDMIVTVAVTGITVAYMFTIIPAVYANTLPGLYIFGMLVQLFIRIVHRFDDSYTVNELAQQVLRIEEENNTRWQNFIDNYIP